MCVEQIDCLLLKPTNVDMFEFISVSFHLGMDNDNIPSHTVTQEVRHFIRLLKFNYLVAAHQLYRSHALLIFF